MRYPVKKVYITQNWGDNPDDYARFGLKGHNGIDFRLFDKNGNRATEAEVFAPHDGKVIETGYDERGYGNYIKIENDKYGSILAHLKSFNISAGESVKEGNLIGIADNTGNSTGSHLHWGVYPIPRYRDNGYSGTINQIPLLSQETQPEPPSARRQLVTDILLALKKNTSENEIDAWVNKFENPKQMIEDLLKNDGRVHIIWFKPLIDKQKEFDDKACESKIREKDEECRIQIDDLSRKLSQLRIDYATLEIKKVENMKAGSLIKLGFKKLFGIN